MFIFRNKKYRFAFCLALTLAFAATIFSGHSSSAVASCPNTTGSPPLASCTEIAGVTVDTTGWGRENSTGLEENKIYVDTDKISLNSAEVTIAGSNLEVVDLTSYTYEQAKARFDAERSTAVSLQFTDMAGKALVVKRSAIQGMSNASTPPHEYKFSGTNSATIKWKKAAKTQSGVELDVVMIIDNITLFLSGKREAPFILFYNRGHYAMTAMQEHFLSGLNDLGDRYYMKNMEGYYDGVSYDVTIKLNKTGTDTPVDSDQSAMAMSISDIDARDSTNNGSGDGWGYWSTTPGTSYPYSGGITLNPDRTNAGNRHYNRSGVPREYAESVTILSGLKQNKVFSYNKNNETSNATDDEDGTYLYFTNNDGNLRITGSRATGSDGEPSTNSSRFLALVDATGFKYRWSGSGCGTTVGFIGVKKVETEITGSYADKATITETDKEVTWRENKVITIAVKSGYKLKTLTLDGRSVLSSATRSGNTWSYTVSDVVADHKVVASVEPNRVDVCKTNLEGEGLGGALLSVEGIDMNGSTIHFDSIVWSLTGNESGVDSEIKFYTNQQNDGCAVLLALPNGDYTLRELEAPDGYKVNADPIVFNITDGVIRINDSVAPSVLMMDSPIDNDDVGLKVEKELRGSTADLNKEFRINIKITDHWSAHIDMTHLSNIVEYRKCYTSNDRCDSQTYSLDFGNTLEATVTIRGGEYLLIPLPHSFGYEINEDNYSSDGYTTTYENKTGTIPYDEFITAKVINSKGSIPNTGLNIDPGAIPFVIVGMMTPAGAVYSYKAFKKSKR